MKREILIETANETTHDLCLKIGGVCADTIEVDKLNTVTWSIVAPNVYSFRIAQKAGSDQIFNFLDRPSTKHTKSTKGWVSIFAKKGDLYDYSIYWKANKDGEEHHYDPKISVNPSFTNFLLPFIAFAGVVSLGVSLSKLIKK